MEIRVSLEKCRDEGIDTNSLEKDGFVLDFFTMDYVKREVNDE